MFCQRLDSTRTVTSGGGTQKLHSFLAMFLFAFFAAKQSEKSDPKHIRFRYCATHVFLLVLGTIMHPAPPKKHAKTMGGVGFRIFGQILKKQIAKCSTMYQQCAQNEAKIIKMSLRKSLQNMKNNHGLLINNGSQHRHQHHQQRIQKS